MTDVRTEDAPARQKDQAGPNPTGDFIWYELMTPDPNGAKTFYDAVVGWTIDPSSSFPTGYRMIGRSDGKFAGGLLPINDEMARNGARPTWLGYVNVADVDTRVDSIVKAGGQALMAPTDIPGVGRIAMVADPQGASFYVMKPIPPADEPEARSDVFSPSSEQRVGWNELQTSDVEAARRFYGDQFGWESREFMDMGEMGQYRFFDHHGVRLGALFDAANGQHPHFRYYIRVPSILAAKRVAEQNGGTIHMGPHQVPTGDWIVVGSDPQGAEFALVGGE
jgi:predicted enzyme related to lactoylglutathione lyase